MIKVIKEIIALYLDPETYGLLVNFDTQFQTGKYEPMIVEAVKQFETGLILDYSLGFIKPSDDPELGFRLYDFMDDDLNLIFEIMSSLNIAKNAYRLINSCLSSKESDSTFSFNLKLLSIPDFWKNYNLYQNAIIEISMINYKLKFSCHDIELPTNKMSPLWNLLAEIMICHFKPQKI